MRPDNAKVDSSSGCASLHTAKVDAPVGSQLKWMRLAGVVRDMQQATTAITMLGTARVDAPVSAILKWMRLSDNS